ncbi:hypothetical protein [Asticcacaulis sp.]|nr:hypothetical protein [Asticcacaulis sp.]
MAMVDDNPVLITISDMVQSVTILSDGTEIVTWQAPPPPPAEGD